MKLEFATCVASIVALASISSAQTFLHSVSGSGTNAQFGKVCIVVPDENGDGYDDVLVGAPGFNSGRGVVYCISGAYLGMGIGSSVLWLVGPPVNAGDKFGFALAAVGDITGDGRTDFLIGQPGYDDGATPNTGAVRLLDGSTHQLVSLIHDDTPEIAFGSSIVAVGDRNNDGQSEVAVGAPGPSQFFTEMSVLDGWLLTSNGTQTAAELAGFAMLGSGFAVGTSIASGFDFDGNGTQDIAVGIPGWDGPGATDAGQCRVLSFHQTFDLNGNLIWTFSSLGTYSSTIAGERLGSSLDGGHDYDGDGALDIVVGAPDWPDGNGLEAGRVLVLSGAKLRAQTPPYEIRTLTLGFGSFVFDFHFGAAVRASGDLNHDGVDDILVGSPDYTSLGSGGAFFNKGLLSIISGATGTRLALIAGANTDRLGDTIAGSIADLDGDGFAELVAAGSLADANGTDSGVVKCYRLFPIAPATYCTAKVNSLGCTPAIAFSGSPKAIPAAPFLVTASNIVNQKTGLLFYSHAPASAVFQDGFKCAADPVRRTGVLASGGSTSGSDCTGTYSFDFNALIQSGFDPSLVAGAEIYAQYWSRDPSSASHTSLSNALRFLINP